MMVCLPASGTILSESLSSPLLPLTAAVVGAIMLLGFYAWLAARSASRAVLATQPFARTDAFCTGFLVLWMVTVILGSLAKPQVITLSAIIVNSVVYSAIIAGIFGVIGFRGLSAVNLFQLGWRRFPSAAATGLLWLMVTYPLIFIVQCAVQGFNGGGDDSQQIVHYFLEHPGLRQRAAVIFMAVIVAPVAEEIIFRGYFYGVMRRFGGRIPALLTSSLLFAAIHVHIPSMPGLALLAVILCLLYERTGSLWAPIMLHATFNASTIAVLLLWPGVTA